MQRENVPAKQRNLLLLACDCSQRHQGAAAAFDVLEQSIGEPRGQRLHIGDHHKGILRRVGIGEAVYSHLVQRHGALSGCGQRAPEVQR